ncbi:adenylosuccinate synthetase [Actinoplanes sp. GCM10030250]|uniref:adenylosuccinate synthetase n=1 Tax=Actinoplanes sp. GCM10030250 TaxID=3273376 RepID=UPI003605D36D
MKSPLRIIVVSGQVGAGKSTLAEALERRFQARRLSTKDALRNLAADTARQLPNERRALQDFGAELDERTAGRWVADATVELLGEYPAAELVIIDAVRLHSQVERLREAFTSAVTHVHVYAPDDELARRYQERGNSSGITELKSYDEVKAHATEANVHKLKAEADIAVDSQRCVPEDVLTRVAAALGLYGSGREQLVDVIVGGQYGSEGKGNIAFYLAPEYDVLMRVGGPNAGHKVPLPTPYTHRLLPSGTQANTNAKLLIGPGATLDVTLLMGEISDCSVDVDRLTIDPQAMVIEDEDKAAEAALVAAIGSTGKGGGHAAARRISGRNNPNVQPAVRLAKDVPQLQPYVRESAHVLEKAFRRGDLVLLEGTQGTELSLYHGSYPHVTSRDTTTAGCLAEAGIGPHRLRRVVQVSRTYPIRVQSPNNATSGPMSQEITFDDIAERSGIPADELHETEKGSVSNKKRRVAEFDWRMLRRAVELNGSTDIALTFTDYLDQKNRDARRYEQLTPETIRFVEEVERVAGIPVSLLGTRFDVRSVIDRRRW